MFRGGVERAAGDGAGVSGLASATCWAGGGGKLTPLGRAVCGGDGSIAVSGEVAGVFIATSPELGVIGTVRTWRAGPIANGGAEVFGRAGGVATDTGCERPRSFWSIGFSSRPTMRSSLLRSGKRS